MMHKPLFLIDVSLSVSSKICFEAFSSQINAGSRIAIIGRNGSGKSSLLSILNGTLSPSSGSMKAPDDLRIGYVEQTINEFINLSGGQRFNKCLSEALALSPALLLLDEPTNHLDENNRKSLIRMLQHFQGTLIVVSHDTELLRTCVDTFWHIDNNKIHEFSGSYENTISEIKQQRASIENQLALIKREKKDSHFNLMKEQKRAAKSKSKGHKSIEQRKWPTVVSNAKAHRAEQTSGKKKSAIDKKKQNLSEELSSLRLPEIILPKFSLTSDTLGSSIVLSIREASIGYSEDRSVLKNVNLTLSGNERVALCGKNASGKSTLLKALLDNNKIIKTGTWHVPPSAQIGYLDQHYSTLNPKLSVIEHLQMLRPDWHETETRRHLNDFLFRKNEEVNQVAATLSGGEKARLSLSLVAAKTPKLLLLDEISNNLDLETKEHVIQVLKKYPGALIVVSHEEEFLQAIEIDSKYELGREAV